MPGPERASRSLDRDKTPPNSDKSDKIEIPTYAQTTKSIKPNLKSTNEDSEKPYEGPNTRSRASSIASKSTILTKFSKNIRLV
ncbi:hypothetical protein JTB14_002439 [Gonioctena quinquepunctata]|nr:hypothetical protein JTB14_002439 [Gonioctena quinquepunctata]